MLSSDHLSHTQRMSDVESSGSYLGLEDPQWLCMVTLFFASLVTLLLYFVQSFQQRGGGRARPAARDDAAQEEAAALLAWALSLESWKGQWRGAWCSALNERSRKSGVSVMTAEPRPSCSVAGGGLEEQGHRNELQKARLI